MQQSPGPFSNVPVMSPTQFKTLMDIYAAAGMQPREEDPGINSTAVKLPNFWSNDPEPVSYTHLTLPTTPYV